LNDCNDARQISVKFWCPAENYWSLWSDCQESIQSYHLFQPTWNCLWN